MAKQLTISRFFKPIEKNKGKDKTITDATTPKTSQGLLDESSLIGTTPETSICLTDEDDEREVDDIASKNVCDAKRQQRTDISHSKNNVIKHRPLKRSNSLLIPQDKCQMLDEMVPVIKKPKIDSSISSDNKRSSIKLTPLDEQVRNLKMQNMDKILVIRVGYKYKCFAQDAIIVSRILQIKLVEGKLTFDGSNPNDKNFKQFAYCSFPDVRLNINLERLIHHDLKIGVVEQSNSNDDNSTVFDRKISSVFSKATYGVNISKSIKYKDTHLLGDTKSIWVLELNKSTNDPLINTYSLLSVNMNSGEIVFDQFMERLNSLDNLLTRVKYLEPIEVLILNDNVETNEEYSSILNKFLNDHNCQRHNLPTIPTEDISIFKDNIYNNLLYSKIENLQNIPKNIYQLIKIMYFHLKQYNTENVLTIFSNYKPFNSKIYMLLDGNTIDSLDIFSNEGKNGSLLWVLDHTRTPFGFRMLREWLKRPLLNKVDIENRLDAIECISKEVSHIFFDSLNQMLKNMPDLLHILNRLTYGRSSRKEVYFFLKQLSSLSNHFKLHHQYINDSILSKKGQIHKQSTLLYEIFNEINEIFLSNKPDIFLSMINVSAVLDKDSEKQIVEFFNLNNYDRSETLINIQRDIDGVREELKNELKTIKQILKRPHLTFKDEIEYLVEVRNTQVKGVPDDWIKVNCTKMVSRFLTPECSKLVDKLKHHKELLIKEAEAEYQHFLSLIKGEYVPLKRVIQRLAEYDCILSLAATSCNINYTRPRFDESKGQFIDIKNGRNAVIESLDVNYVPNDVKMHNDKGRINIITGPNMGGKSSYIRQVALLVIMAQIGSFVPADSMESSLFDNILTRIGAYDDLIRGQSTFKIEMSEILHIIKNATAKSLLLLDEVGRGTGTIDGKAISYSLLKYFMELEECPLILFTTHFTMLGEQLKLKNCNLFQEYFMDYIEVQDEGEDWQSVIFLYKLKPGVSKDSFGLNVAKLAKIDKNIINHAHKIANKIRHEEEMATYNISSKVRSILAEDTSSKKKVNTLVELAASLQ